MAHYSSDGRSNDQDYDASESAALVAVNLISAARVILKLDSVYTEYSSQYLVDNASPKKEEGQGGMDLKLTVKDCFEFAFKEGIPKADVWPHLGSKIKPPSSYKPALVSMKGEVIEGKKLEDAYKMLVHQPVGAKLHVFSPEIDLVGDGILDGPLSDRTSYVGLRDVIILGVKKIEGETVAEVKYVTRRRFHMSK